MAEKLFDVGRGSEEELRTYDTFNIGQVLEIRPLPEHGGDGISIIRAMRKYLVVSSGTYDTAMVERVE